MKFTEIMIEKAKAAASAEELIKIAAEEGEELTAEDAEKYFQFLNGNGELPDEALEAVAGGKGTPAAKFKAGQHVCFWFGYEYLNGKIKSCKYSELQGAWYYITNPDSGQIYYGESCDGKEWDLPLELPVYKTTVI